MSTYASIEPPDLPAAASPTLPAWTGHAADWGDGLLLDSHTVADLSLGESNVSKLTLERVAIDRVLAPMSKWRGFKAMDMRWRGGDASNATWDGAVLRRVVFDGVRMTGNSLLEASLHHVLFRGCALDLASLAMASFETCRFEDCNLRGADLRESDLTGVQFIACDLREARVNGATLNGADIRSSRIDGIEFNPGDVRGLIVAPMQLIHFAPVLGVEVRGIDETAV